MLSELQEKRNRFSSKPFRLMMGLGENRLSTEFLRTKKNYDELLRLLDNLPALIGYWDRDLNNRHSNKKYSEYFGKAPSEIKGRSIFDLLGPELYEKNKPHIEAALKGIEQTFEREIPLPGGVGVRQTIASYIPDIIDGVVQGFFVIVTDISQIKKLEEERREFKAKLVHASKMSSLGEMASGIAHEINNPLAIIKGRASQI